MGETIEKPIEIVIARDFSRFPAGRFNEDGPYSGQAFREKKLILALRAGKRFIINLDGTAGYGSSFLEEAFGGLVRAGFKPAALEELIEFKSADPSVAEEILEYIRNAAARSR